MSPKVEGSVQYSEGQIQDMFFRTLRTGLKDFGVLTRVNALLWQGVGDERLMAEVNAAAIEEAERANKRKTVSNKPVTVAQTSTEMSGLLNPLMQSINNLKEEVNSLRVEVADVRKRNHSPSPSVRYTRGCTYCRKDGRGESCRHCWNCGAGDHTAQYCRKPQNQKNW